jgi:hypothetical protein
MRDDEVMMEQKKDDGTQEGRHGLLRRKEEGEHTIHLWSQQSREHRRLVIEGHASSACL